MNYDDIEQLGLGLNVVAGELENSESIADDYGEDAGNDDLASALESFADNWSDKRDEIVEDIRIIAALAEGAGQAFGLLDQNLKEAVEEE